MREGISDDQWASLEKHNRKKNQEKHRVEKWFEIWKILFPNAPMPETPCKKNGPMAPAAAACWHGTDRG